MHLKFSLQTSKGSPSACGCLHYFKFILPLSTKTFNSNFMHTSQEQSKKTDMPLLHNSHVLQSKPKQRRKLEKGPVSRWFVCCPSGGQLREGSRAFFCLSLLFSRVGMPGTFFTNYGSHAAVTLYSCLFCWTNFKRYNCVFSCTEGVCRIIMSFFEWSLCFQL
jgi:hypothetical protein